MNAFKIDWSKVTDLQKETPILIHHGEDDDMIQCKKAMRTYQEFLDNGFKKIEIETEKGLGHHLSLNEINRVKKYLKKMMP